MAATPKFTRQSRYPNYLDYVGYGTLHVACLGALWTGCSRRDLIIFGVTYVSRMFGLMAGFHRYFSHRSFKTSRPIQFALALLGTLGIQKGVLWWASHHRHHHRYSDTERDVHSPVHKSFLYSHSGWFLDVNNRDTDYSRVSDLLVYPEIVWLNDWDLVPVAIYGVLLVLFFGCSGFVWGFCISTILIWHGIHAIGSFGHRLGGYRRFATTDNSRNKWFIALVLLGEGWHNNHHFYPGSARQGFVWWEYDLAYYVLKAMSWFGLVWDLRVPPGHVIHSKDRMSHSLVRRFQEWLVDLRLEIAYCINDLANDAPTDNSGVTARATLARHAIELRLDLFSAEATGWLIKEPERMRDCLEALRCDIATEIRSHDFDPALISVLDAHLMDRVSHCPAAHLFGTPALAATKLFQRARGTTR